PRCSDRALRPGGPVHMADPGGNALLDKEPEPGPLVVLEPVPGALHLDEFVAGRAPGPWPEADQVRQPAAVGREVRQQPGEDRLEVGGRDAVEGEHQQLPGEQRPGYQRAGDALAAVPVVEDAPPVVAPVEARQAVLHQGPAAGYEVLPVKVRGPRLK